MAARKGKGRQAVRNRKGGFPAWGWAVIGIAVGVIAMVALTRHSMLPMAPSGPQPNPQATAQGDGDKGLAPAESAAKKPQYDFYSVLSEKEVRIPDDQISAQARAEQQQKQQAAQQAQAAAAAQQQQAANPNAPAAVSENIQAAPATAVPQPAAGSGYLLQVGAFPNAADAEALKAKLALQGFVANVQTVQVGNQTFHRVRLGPYRSATELESVQNRLAGAGYKAIALKEGR
ncbi:SPOR domain-containing protein [Frateuria sp. GZRR33]|uniref:SPOR domain-containing protein n=1 Tax=Frateuria sp. GZRR33 TaxID=3351535 RepID=UPI003EDC2DAB